MRWYKADLHIHTVLSPCGGLDMSPVNIIRDAVQKKLDIIAITDHNSTKHCRSAQYLGKKYGITVLAGAEVNSKEEIHCLAFFDNMDKTEEFQKYLDEQLMVIENKPSFFGEQYVVDESENILEEEPRLLIASLKAGIDDIADTVARLKGIFIPAHINRKSNSIFSQLGFFPELLKADAIEVSPVSGYMDFLAANPETGKYVVVFNSDAHSLNQIGSVTTEYYLDMPDFHEILKALRKEDGRKARI
jgi:3',5'-nucleoside bisphosphate phosphatase